MGFANSRRKVLVLAFTIILALQVLTSCQQQGPQPTELTNHVIAHGYFNLATPAGWKLEEEELWNWQNHPDSSTSLRIENAEGQVMAMLLTGGAGATDVQPGPQGEKYTQLEHGETSLEERNHFSFDAWGQDGETASINVNFFDREKQDSFVGQSMFLYDEKHGTFERNIPSNEPLTDVPAELIGMDRLKAYQATDEYMQLKAMMMSLTRSKAARG